MHRTHETISSSGMHHLLKKGSTEFALDPRIRKLSNNVNIYNMSSSSRVKNGTPQSASKVNSEKKETGQFLKIDDYKIKYKASKTYIDEEDN